VPFPKIPTPETETNTMKSITSLRPQNSSDNSAQGVPPPLSYKGRLFAAVAGGAGIGSAVGVFCGPVGALAGALLGAAAGALSARASQRWTAWSDQNEKVLDATIGISGGEMGAQPAARESGYFTIARHRSEVDFFEGMADEHHDERAAA
jgi:hypothetical protein